MQRNCSWLTCTNGEPGSWALSCRSISRVVATSSLLQAVMRLPDEQKRHYAKADAMGHGQSPRQNQSV